MVTMNQVHPQSHGSKPQKNGTYGCIALNAEVRVVTPTRSVDLHLQWLFANTDVVSDR